MILVQILTLIYEHQSFPTLLFPPDVPLTHFPQAAQLSDLQLSCHRFFPAASNENIRTISYNLIFQNHFYSLDRYS